LGKAGANGKNVVMSPLAFFFQQFWVTGPVPAVVWLCGLWAGIARPKLAVARAFAIAWLILLFVFDYSHGKPYYLSAIYPTLLAFGALRLEEWLSNPIARRAVLASLAILGAIGAPMTLPILPIDTFVRYQRAIGIAPSSDEHHEMGALPQYYADMFGWREMAEKIAEVYNALPPQDRAKAVFYGENYGEAAAIDVFGRRMGLPPAIAGHNNYYLWGPRGHDGSVMIIVGGNTKHYDEIFTSYEVAGHTDTAYAMPYEANQPIYVLRGLKTPLPDFWSTVKNYN
jgi:hypothetical protein